MSWSVQEERIAELAAELEALQNKFLELSDVATNAENTVVELRREAEELRTKAIEVLSARAARDAWQSKWKETAAELHAAKCRNAELEAQLAGVIAHRDELRGRLSFAENADLSEAAILRVQLEAATRVPGGSL